MGEEGGGERPETKRAPTHSATGHAATSMPMFARLRWPPLTPRLRSSPMTVCCTWPRLSAASVASTCAATSAPDHAPGRRTRAEYSTLSRTLSSRSMMSSCGT